MWKLKKIKRLTNQNEGNHLMSQWKQKNTIKVIIQSSSFMISRLRIMAFSFMMVSTVVALTFLCSRCILESDKIIYHCYFYSLSKTKIHTVTLKHFMQSVAIFEKHTLVIDHLRKSHFCQWRLPREIISLLNC